MVALLHRATIN